MRCLLDKVVARYTLSGLLKLAENNTVTKQELFSINLFAVAAHLPIDLYIVPSSAHVLQRLVAHPRYSIIAQRFQDRVAVVFPARYYKRWARRLRARGFSKEDAEVLALATFGTDEDGTILGMHSVVTYDLPLLNHWSIQKNVLEEHLKAMKRDILPPYCNIGLPQVLRPEQMIVFSGELPNSFDAKT